MYTHEFALLAAVAIPFLTLVGLNVYLWSEGERGTLLVPSTEALQVVLEAREESEEVQPVGYEVAPVANTRPAMVEAVPANDVHEREAA